MLAISDGEKSKLLVRFYDDLLAKSTLPSLKAIQMFTEESGLNPIEATSRSRAFVPLLEQLKALSVTELHDKLPMARSADLNDRSLEGWNSLILNQRQPKK